MNIIIWSVTGNWKSNREGNLLPVNMFKMLFSRTPIEELNKYINKKVRLCTYNNFSIPQVGICRVTIKNKLNHVGSL